MQADGHVVRQRPRRGRPDDDIAAAGVGLREDVLQLLIRQGEAHEDGRRRVIGVLHFRLGQRRMAGTAPVNGLLGAHHVAFFHKAGQFARGNGLIGRGHAAVGIFPVAQHAETAKFLALNINPLAGIIAAALAHHMGGQGLFLFLQLLLDLVLDGQAVAVPARHVAGLEALHVARLDDDVLQNLVERRAHVNVPVGIGRAVVQHIGALGGAGVHHGRVGVALFPLLEHLGLALGKIGLHGEGGLRQIQGLFIVAHAGSRGATHFCVQNERRHARRKHLTLVKDAPKVKPGRCRIFASGRKEWKSPEPFSVGEVLLRLAAGNRSRRLRRRRGIPAPLLF